MACPLIPLCDPIDHFQLMCNKIYILHSTLYTFAYIKLSQGLLSSEGSFLAFIFILSQGNGFYVIMIFLHVCPAPNTKSVSKQ